MIIKGKNKLFVSCNCGCGNILEFDVLDNTVFISVSQSSFYQKQQTIKDAIFQKISLLKKHCEKQEKIITEFILSQDEARDFIEALYELEIEDGGEQCINDSYLKFEIISELIEYDSEEYVISLINKQSLKDMLGHEYRAYDLALNKKQFDKFKELCKKTFLN